MENWSEKNINFVQNNLVQFLTDYKKEFNVENVNPSCANCLQSYLNDFKKKYKVMNKSGYVLKEKYQGIQLEFGSSVMVNNTNITKEWAKNLIKNHPLGADLFDVIPSEKPEPKEKKTKETELKETEEKEIE